MITDNRGEKEPDYDTKNAFLSNGSVHLVYGGKATEEEIYNGVLVRYSKVYSNPSGKRLYFGDNMDVLRLLIADPEVCGKINLIYIDPPFATQSQYVSRKQSKAYEDTVTGAAFVEFEAIHEAISARKAMHMLKYGQETKKSKA